MFFNKKNNFNVSAYPKVDTREAINRYYGIDESSKFLVLKVNIPWTTEETSCWCIASKQQTDRDSSEVTHLHWGFVLPDVLTFPKIQMPAYVPMITADIIQEFGGQFANIEDATNCYLHKISPHSPRAKRSSVPADFKHQ